MKELVLITVLSLTFGILALAEVGAGGHYELYEINCRIENDRSLRVEKTMVFKNTARENVRLPENTIISSIFVENIRAWDNLDWEFVVENETTRISFWTRWIPPRMRYTYHLSYSIRDAVVGVDGEYELDYRALVADSRLEGTAYENYVLTVEGPRGTYPFLSDPEVELVSLDPPIWRHSTRLEENEDFGWFRVKFYENLAFYKVTLNRTFSNPADSPTNDLTVIVLLLNSGVPWQFSSIIASSPLLETLYFDRENNLYAVLKLGDIPPGGTKSFSIELLYKVEIHVPEIDPDEAGDIHEVPTHLGTYLQSDRMWESDHPEIRQAAQEAVGEEKNVYSAAESIIRYVVDRLEYEDQAEEERRGALWTLRNRRGDCSEYTDLSIALARAVGIPARAQYGWSYSENGALRGHAWLEFFLPGKGWQPADPTWTEDAWGYFARLDPTHLTRSVRGLVSTELFENMIYHGSPPETEKGEDVRYISSSDAAELYLSAARYHISIASKLLNGVENDELRTILEMAQTELSSAENAGTVSDRILHAEKSISYTNDIIQALGVFQLPEKRIFDLGPLFPLAAAVVAVCVIAAAICVVVKRR